MAMQRWADQLGLRRSGANIDHASIVGLLVAGPDLLVPELHAALLHDQECRPTHGADEHRTEQERHHAADQGANEHLGIGNRQRAGFRRVLRDGSSRRFCPRF